MPKYKDKETGNVVEALRLPQWDQDYSSLHNHWLNEHLGHPWSEGLEGGLVMEHDTGGFSIPPGTYVISEKGEYKTHVSKTQFRHNHEPLEAGFGL